MKKALKWVGNIITVILVLAMAVLVFFTLGGKLSKDGLPKIAKYKMMVVLSGSMHPAFEAGDVVIVFENPKKDSYKKDDIITFKDPGDIKRIITHRIVEVLNEKNLVSYKTKGDANDTADLKPVPAINVIGQEKMHIPYLGRAVEFAKTKQGFIWLIVVPGLFIILSELRGISKAITNEIGEKKTRGC